MFVSASVTMSRFICLLLVMLILLAKVNGHTWLSRVDDEHHKEVNATSLEELEPISNCIRFDKMDGIREWDIKRYFLWEIVSIHYMEYVNSRISIVGLLLFGPEKDRSTLRAVRSPEHVVDDWQCSTFLLHIWCDHLYLLNEIGFIEVEIIQKA